MGRLPVLVSVLLAACASGAPATDPTIGDAGLDKGDTPLDLASSISPRATSATIPLRLQHGATGAAASDPPNALAYLPAGLRVGVTLDVVVHVHGFYNCIDNVLGAVDGPCTPKGPTRQAHHLAAQLEASKRNAILLLPEVLPSARDAASAEPGALADDGGLRAFLDEALDALAGELGLRPQLGQVVVQVHSGGYKAAAAFAARGGVTVDELFLLDALYGERDTFDAWIGADPARFLAAPKARYVVVYTAVGGTLAESQAQATRVAAFAAPGTILDDRTTATLATADYARGLLWKRSGLDHDGVVRYYVERLLTTSGIGAR